MQRLLPPGPGNPATITVNCRSYSCALGAFLDVNDADAQVMVANGWIAASPGGAVGPTALRPLNPAPSQTFFDTTVGAQIVFDGSLWVNPDTGLAV